MQSNAGELWDAIRSGRITPQHFVADKISESVVLEYKTVPANYKEKDFRSTVSKVVSGFANSAGGVVVWGVATGERREKDIPVAIPGVPEPHEFAEWLNTVIPNAVQPACVTHTIIASNIVVTYIPESDLPPHQAVLEDNKPYYTRLDGQFKVMEHHMLEDMFGRRRRPRLTLGVNLKSAPRQQTGPSLQTGVIVSTFEIIVNNEGRGAARYPTIYLYPIKGPNRLKWKNLRPWAKEHRDGVIEYSLGVDRIIYHDSGVIIGELDVFWTSHPEAEVRAILRAEDMSERNARYILKANGEYFGGTNETAI